MSLKYFKGFKNLIKIIFLKIVFLSSTHPVVVHQQILEILNFMLWHRVLLVMFLYQSPETALKNTQNLPFYSILKLTFLKIFKDESFRFSKLKKKFILWHSELLDMFLCQSTKTTLKNTKN